MKINISLIIISKEDDDINHTNPEDKINNSIIFQFLLY